MQQTPSPKQKAIAVEPAKAAAAPTRRFSISRLELAGRPMVAISAKAS